jgi:ABC-type transport system involved in multi-copper enzyme maturation permease subunit
MSTATAPGTPTAPGDPGSLDLGSTPSVSFGTLVKIELRKSYDTRAGLWLLIVTAGLSALAMVIVLLVAITQDVPTRFGDFLGTTSLTSQILLPIVGIMLVTSEWSQRTAMVTFTLEAHRARVIMAKLVAGLLLSVVVSLVGLVAAVLANLVYAGAQGDASWEHGVRLFVGFLAAQMIAMVSGFALATLLLNTAAGIVVYFVYRFVLPTIFAVASGLIGWFSDLNPWIDFQSAQGPLFEVAALSGKDWAHLLVSGFIWLVVPLALGLWRVLRAEVK